LRTAFSKTAASEGIKLGDADAGDEGAERAGGDAAATQAGNRGHARVVPAGHDLLVDELEELALRHEGVGEVEFREFVLVRKGAGQAEGIEHPVVERAVVHELEGADGVCDPLKVIAQAVGIVVERVDAPLVAGVVMGDVADAVEERVAQPHVGRGHVDLAAQRARAVGELAGLHPLEQVEVLGDGAVAEGTVLTRAVGRAAVFLGVLGAQVADVGLAAADEFEGVFVELVEIVAREKCLAVGAGCDRSEVVIRLAVAGDLGRMRALGLEAEAVVGPAGNEPLHVGGDGLHVFDILLDGIGVVEAQVALAVVLAGDAEVQADGFGVADVQVAVGLGRETRDDLGVAFFGNVAGDDIADEIAGRRRGSGVLDGHSHP
jgi:hypothetical protein